MSIMCPSVASTHQVQFCMALGSQILMSVEWPAVTNARTNGDGGLDVAALVLPSVLASVVGLGWSKDNLRTADRSEWLIDRVRMELE